MDTRGRGGSRGFMRGGRGSMRGGPPNQNNNGGLLRGSGGGRGMSSRGRRGSIRGAPSHHMSPQNSGPMSGQGGPGRRVLFGSNRRGGTGAPRGGPVRGRPHGGDDSQGNVGHPQNFNDYQIGGGYQGDEVGLYEGSREYQGGGGYSIQGGKGFHSEGYHGYQGEENYRNEGGFHGEQSYQTERGYHAVRGYPAGRGYPAHRGNPAERGYPAKRGYAERGYHAGGREDETNYESAIIGSMKSAAYNRMMPQGAAGPAKRGRWDPSYSKEVFNRSVGDYSSERPISGNRYVQEDPFSMDANGEGVMSDYEIKYPINEYSRAGPDKKEIYGTEGHPPGPISGYADIYAEKRNLNLGLLDPPDTVNYQTYDGYSSAPQEMYQSKDFGSMGGSRSSGDDHYGYETYREMPSYGGHSHEGYDVSATSYGPPQSRGGLLPRY